MSVRPSSITGASPRPDLRLRRAVLSQRHPQIACGCPQLVIHDPQDGLVCVLPSMYTVCVQYVLAISQSGRPPGLLAQRRH